MGRTQQFTNNQAGLTIRNMLNAFLDWKSTYSYNIDDCAIYNGMIYKSLTNTNLNHTPEVGAYWDLFQYQLGDLSGVDLVDPAIDEVIKFDGTSWVNSPNTSGMGLSTVVNPGFETTPGSGSNVFASWDQSTNSDTNGYVEASVLIKHSGGTGAKLTKGSSATWSLPNVNQTFAVTAGTQYKLSFWTRGDNSFAGQYAVQNVQNGTYIIANTTTGVVANVWTKVTALFTAPTACTSVKVYLSPSSTEDHYVSFDDVAFQEVLVGTENILPRVILPNRFTAIVGKELQLFTRGIIEAQDPYSVPYEMICTKGKDRRRYFSYTPVAGDVAASPYTLTYNVLDNAGTVIATKSCVIDVATENTAPATNVNVLTMGDSMTAFGTWPTELYRMLTQSGGSPTGKSYGNITFCGDKAIDGYAGAAYTAYPSWSYGYYAGTTYATDGHILTGTFDKDKTDIGSIFTDGTNQWKILYATGALKIIPVVPGTTLANSGTLTHVSGGGGTHYAPIIYTSKTNEPVSPFWDANKVGGAGLSFTAWATRNGYTDVDVLYVLMGWGGITKANMGEASDWNLTSMDTVLQQFHTDFPDAKVKVIGINVPSIEGGLGATYGATGSYANYYKSLRSVMGLNLAYQAYADTNNTWVEFINLSAQLDSEYNMLNTATAVNTRNTTTELLGTSGTYPDTEGLYQIADAAYRNFIKNYCG